MMNFIIGIWTGIIIMLFIQVGIERKNIHMDIKKITNGNKM